MEKTQDVYHIRPIGTVRRNGDDVCLEIDEPFRPAMRELGGFSHVMVFWWADRFADEEHRTTLQMNPPYAEDHLTGVFASRSPVRPNPLGMTTCKVVDVDEAEGVIRVADIDAFDGTPVVDLKAYFPVCDRVQTAHIPKWLVGWPEWMPEDGIGLQPGEA
ncbi:MAG TPA: tRNA (N6-threonylcarbamoyladenosine(37)-N6)-methyltransferase TrmO [Chloroflexi bacterium]|nr:tRNA (N6-threonylcarbamoyladenosine(37)-N6)-methyltransferase TrmO [Chloroflexota bacterium]